MECFGSVGSFKGRLDRKGSQNPMIRLKAPHFLQMMAFDKQVSHLSKLDTSMVDMFKVPV